MRLLFALRPPFSHILRACYRFYNNIQAHIAVGIAAADTETVGGEADYEHLNSGCNWVEMLKAGLRNRWGAGGEW